MEERDAPKQPAPTRAIDPSHYSLSAEVGPKDETFEESEDIRSWEGGNTDFSFDDEDAPPVKIDDPETYMKNLPSPEELLDD